MRRLCLLTLISLPALLAESAQPLAQSELTQFRSQTELAEAIDEPSTRRLSDSLLNTFSAASAAAANRELHDFINDEQLTPVQRDAVLQRLLLQLRNQQQSPALTAVVKQLRSYKSTITVPHHDDQRFPVPAFNIAATADGTLREWR